MSDESSDGALSDSGFTNATDRFGAAREHVHSFGRLVFGDRVGLLVWLGLVLALATMWRVGIFLTDTYTVANTLVNVADGHLAITSIEYSLAMGAQPGLHQYEGVLYGRNYGQAFFALPVLWVLDTLAAVAEPRFVLLGGWALGVVAFARHLGVVAGRAGDFSIAGHSIATRPVAGYSITVGRDAVVVAGSALAILAVLVGVRVGTPLDPDAIALAALQLSTLLAAATIGLVAYRLLATLEGRRVGVAAGVAAGLATPIGFWASIPKRHVLVAALLMAAVYCFARARQTDSLRLRAAAYAFAGLIAWIHAFEGFFVVCALGAVDLATASSNGRRQLAVVALALLLALSPAFATNAAISGNPLKSPRLLPSVGVGDVELSPSGEARAGHATGGINTGGGGGDFLGDGSGDGAGSADGGGTGDGATDGGTAGDGTGSGATGDGTAGGPLSWIVGLLGGLASALIGLLPRPPDTVLVIASFVLTTVTDGLGVLGDLERLGSIFLRGGNVPGVNYGVNGFEVIDLSVLESMPLLGALAAVPVLALGSIRRRGRSLLRWPRSLSPARQTDLLVVTVATVFTVIYLSRLPVQSMLTVRYIMPLYPLGLYGVARLGPVSSSVAGRPRVLASAYAGSILVGGLAVITTLSVLDPALGEAIQFHALVNLAAAAVLATMVVGRSIAPARVRPAWVAGALGIAGAATTIYLGLAAAAYFPYGAHALDLARMVAEALGPLV